jgi:hypothetical protein
METSRCEEWADRDCRLGEVVDKGLFPQLAPSQFTIARAPAQNETLTKETQAAQHRQLCGPVQCRIVAGHSPAIFQQNATLQ